MSEKMKTIIRNLNYTITANFLVLGISVILNLVVPKYLGVVGYSYWQLYVFYSSYIGFFHLGLIDGIYLKIGGEKYDDLDKSNLGMQLKFLFLMEMIFGILLSSYAFLFVSDINRKFIWLSISMMLIISNIKSFVLFILQSTNRIMEYAKISRNDRYIYIISTMIYLLTGGRSPLVLIFLDVFSQLILTIYGLVRIKDIVVAKPNSLYNSILEAKDNILIGSNLMLGYIASILVIGVPRLMTERRWSIETFGKLSFALSISSMFMVFINSISVVLYPVLRRSDSEKLSNIYIQARTVFVPFTMGLLLLFLPMKMILEWWLPTYQESLFFMGILFPMIIYEGRTSLLINTYLKTIRQERIILVSNVLTLLVSSVLSFFSVYVLDSVTLMVIMIMFSLAFRSIISEIMLARVLKISIVKENVLEFIIVVLFILGNLTLNNIHSFFVYFVIFTVFILSYKSKIKKSLSYFNRLSKIG